jgi:Haspin like kinase domain
MSATPDVVLGISGIRTTIIDYTLSRAAKEDSSTVIYDPMKAISIFKGVGQTPEQKYQFETYRNMRKCAVEFDKNARKSAPAAEKGPIDKWSHFIPRTNCLWLGCLLFTLLYRARERFLTQSSDTSRRLQGRLYTILEEMLQLLEETDSEKQPQSAKDLLVIAERNQWVTSKDLTALKSKLEEEG